MNRRDLFKLAGKVGFVALAQQVPWGWIERAGLVGECLAEAATLPSNYRRQNATATLVDQSLGNAVNLSSGVSVFAGDGSVLVEDTTDPQYLLDGATKALKITITPGAVSTRIRPVFTIAGSTQAGFRTIGMPFWVVPGSGSMDICGIQLGDATLSNFFAWDARNGTGIGGWRFGANMAHGTRGYRTSATGSPAYGTTTFARIRLDIRAMTGSGPLTIVIGDIIQNFETKPQVILVLDDQSDTQYTYAFPYMNARGLPGSIAFASKFGGQANCLTDSMVNEMLAAGWSIHNHSDQHPVLSSGVTADFAYADTMVCRNYLAARGWDRNNIYVAPGAATSDVAWQGVQSAGYTYNVVGDALSGYGDLNSTYHGLAQQSNHIYRCSNREASSALGLTFFLAKLDEAEATGRSMGFIIHSITNSAGNLSPTDFQLLIDEIYRRVSTNRIDCVNLEDYVRRFTNPRKRRAA